MLSLASRKQGWNIYSYYGIFLSQGLVFCLIKQLSEWITWVEWKEWFVLSGYTRPISMVYLVYLTCGWPPRNKEIWDVKCWEASSAATWHYGLCLDHIGCNNLAIWTVGGSGMIGWSASIWSKGRLLKGPVLVKPSLVGKVHHLCRV